MFAGADKIYIYEPASQGAGTHAQLTQKEIVERVQRAGFAAQAITNAEEALQSIVSDTQENDAVLLLTSGDLGGLIKSLPPAVEQKFSQRV